MPSTGPKPKRLKSLVFANMMRSTGVDASTGARVISAHFVYSIKTNESFIVTKFKARYVVDGNRQEPLVDYYRTKSDVADSKSMRICLFAGAVCHGEFFQVDVDSAYLQSDPISEVLYILAPPGYPTKYALVKKPVYGMATGW